MNKKIIAIGIIFMFLLGSSLSLSAIGINVKTDSYNIQTSSSILPLNNGNTLYVGGSGPDNYSKIQDAIDDASDGDVVFVYRGTYYEHVLITKTINLIGEDKETTIIDGEKKYGGIIIIHDTCGVNVKGFTVKNTADSGELKGLAGILIRYSDDTFISECKFLKDVTGICVARYSKNNIIKYNLFTDSAYGVYLQGSATKNNEISWNEIYGNDAGGIYLDHYPSNNVISNNLIRENYEGICIFQGHNNIIYHNNLILNTRTASDFEGTNIWYNASLEEGNYYSAYYPGVDEDGDGIGDTPYEIFPYIAKDEYPLMTAWRIESDPPEKPTVDGPITPKLWNILWGYTYTAVTTDPNDDKIRYLFDWDDGTTTLTYFYLDSGVPAEVTHRWNEPGRHNIRVKARDIYGYESEWSDPLSVSMPVNQPQSQPNTQQSTNPLFLQILQRLMNIR